MKANMGILCDSMIALLRGGSSLPAAQQWKDTTVAARDGDGDYHTPAEAMKGIWTFTDYKVIVLIKKGIYKKKVILPSQLENADFIGKSAGNAIITYDDHANINKMGTLHTYTLKIEGNFITFKNLTIENNATRPGQAVMFHTEGDHLTSINYRSLGNQDTIYTGAKGTRLYFLNCYIEGTTDLIFGPSTASFWNCTIHSKNNLYITAIPTPKDVEVGYVFRDCKSTAAPRADKVYLGRPWRSYAATVFINYKMGEYIRPEGWHNWDNSGNEKAARYTEFGSTGEGADCAGQVRWVK